MLSNINRTPSIKQNLYNSFIDNSVLFLNYFQLYFFHVIFPYFKGKDFRFRCGNFDSLLKTVRDFHILLFVIEYDCQAQVVVFDMGKKRQGKCLDTFTKRKRGRKLKLLRDEMWWLRGRRQMKLKNKSWLEEDKTSTA